jgi:ABC-2 type transport system permease protein
MILRHIARHALRDVVRDGRFRWCAAIVGALLLTALLAGASEQRRVAAEHASAARLSRETWLGQAAKDPHTAAHYGSYVFKPRGPLTLFDNGVTAYTGAAAWLEAHKQNEFQFRAAQDASAIARLGQATAAGTLQLLVPLLIVLLAFTKFAGDREDGMLRQVLAQGVSPRWLAIGSIAGVSTALALVLLPAAIIGALALVWTSGGPAVAGEGWRVVALALTYCGYFGIFLTIGLAASAALRRSSHVLAALIALWMLNSLLVPRAVVDVSRRLHPSQTAFDMSEGVRRDSYDGLPIHEYHVRRAEDLRTRLLTNYGVRRVEDLPVNFRGIDYLEREAHSNQVWDEYYGRLRASFAQQMRVQDLAGFVAPLLAVRSVSMALAGTDLHHHQHFADAAETYRRRLVLTMNSELAYADGSARRGAYAADPSVWKSVPAFQYEAPPIGWALGHARLNVLSLVVWLCAAPAALAFSVRRMHAE